MSKWKPIESAPKDGTEILAFERLPTGDYYRVMYWEDRGEHIDTLTTESGWSKADSGYIGEFHPTHWQSLPKPPEATQ
jgi:hypothetical protein